MTIRFTPEQSATWEAGGRAAYILEETLLEALEREGITEPVVVELDTGAVAFALYKE